MATQASTAELVAALGRTASKAEIVGGEIVLMSATGDLPSRAAGAVYRSLWDYERRTRSGRAYTDNVGFLVDLPGRKSFGPDASYYVGPPAGAKFLEGAPVFAAEVRSEGDYGPAAEEAMAAKRADYFRAGTRVVWDVDVLREGLIRVYRAEEPESPTAYGRGGMAEATLALPGWSFPVDDIFE